MVWRPRMLFSYSGIHSWRRNLNSLKQELGCSRKEEDSSCSQFPYTDKTTDFWHVLRTQSYLICYPPSLSTCQLHRSTSTPLGIMANQRHGRTRVNNNAPYTYPRLLAWVIMISCVLPSYGLGKRSSQSPTRNHCQASREALPSRR